jgi:hypothetical protein
VAKLILVASGELKPFCDSQRYQALSFFGTESKGLFNIYVATVLEAVFGDFEVAFGRRGDMDDVGSSRGQKVSEVGEAALNREAIRELLGHQGLPVVRADDLTSLYPQDLGCVSIRNLTASNDGDLKHGAYVPMCSY